MADIIISDANQNELRLKTCFPIKNANVGIIKSLVTISIKTSINSFFAIFLRSEYSDCPKANKTSGAAVEPIILKYLSKKTGKSIWYNENTTPNNELIIIGF